MKFKRQNADVTKNNSLLNPEKIIRIPKPTKIKVNQIASLPATNNTTKQSRNYAARLSQQKIPRKNNSNGKHQSKTLCFGVKNFTLKKFTLKTQFITKSQLL